MRRVPLVLLPAAAVLLLSACADPGTGTGGGGGGATSAPAGSATASPSPSASPSRTPAVPPPIDVTKSPGGRQLTVDGVVEQGVEPGCRVLAATGRQYLLLGRRDIPLGVPVRIKGVVLTGVSTTCQQGTPLRVVDVRRR